MQVRPVLYLSEPTSPNTLVGADRAGSRSSNSKLIRESVLVSILVTCKCGKQFQTKVENAGRRARCPDCGNELIIPSPGGVGDIDDGPYLAPDKGGGAARALAPR